MTSTHNDLHPKRRNYVIMHTNLVLRPDCILKLAMPYVFHTSHKNSSISKKILPRHCTPLGPLSLL